MIFLRKPNLLFFKTHKTAATSVEIALSGNSTDADIITPLGLPDEVIRIRMGCRRPTNWAKHRWIELFLNNIYYGEYLGRERRDVCCTHTSSQTAIRHDASFWGRGISQLSARTPMKARNALYVTLRSMSHFRQHMKPVDVVSKLGEELFWSACKVSICRHPYEQLVSHAYWKMRNHARSDLGDVHTKIDQLLEEPSHNEQFYLLGGKKVCDMIIRYEHLREDLEKIERQFGLSLLDRLPLTKENTRKDRRPAHEFLSRRQMIRCYKRNRLEFEMFGYDPFL